MSFYIVNKKLNTAVEYCSELLDEKPDSKEKNTVK